MLDFIRETEVGRSDRASYDVIYANKQNRLKQPLTTMTFGDIVDAQKAWSKNFGSSAAGGYQFMRATLIGLAKEIPSISRTDRFVPDLQDRLGYHLLKRRGYDQFVTGNMTLVEFGKRLAMEWASFPVLVDTQGDCRKVKRGQSYYAGDGLNKALVRPEKVEAVLSTVLATARRPAGSEFRREAHVSPTPTVRPSEPVEHPAVAAQRKAQEDFATGEIVLTPANSSPAKQPASRATRVAALIAASVLGLGAWFASLPCSIFGVFCQ